MRPTLIDRRDFVRGAGLAFLATLAPSRLRAATSTDAVYATAFQKRSGEYGVAILSEAGALIHAEALPERGHDSCFDPVSRRTVVFARQPGTFALVFDHANRNPPLTITSIPGRHFYGHGLFSPDGALLYATENDYDNAAGMIGIYDARDGFVRLGEFPTHGVGPHEMLLLGDGVTFAVANGGIETHPDFGRAKLNIPTMQPSLVFLDRDGGRLQGKYQLTQDLHQLSIRHMDEDASGAIWFGCQHEGDAGEQPPLIGRARPGADMLLTELPPPVLAGFRNYIGSVAANRTAGTVAFSSPQGNRLAILDAATGIVVSATDMREVCGVAPDGEGFMATSGDGTIALPGGLAVEMPELVFDNHILRIG
ncbi:MAG: DUF1513 domain-containing protein [Mesorhizobium sp.]|nr:DUF1513 domain-containing protein [Mesorhizobium sp.]